VGRRWGARALLVVGLVALVAIVLGPGPDTPAPAVLAPVVEPARQLARDKQFVANVFGLRLVRTSCAPDRRSGALMFEAAFTSVHTYAFVGFPAASEAQQPGAATVIVGLTEREFQAEQPGWLWAPCG
jgi:hypothetical protein